MVPLRYFLSCALVISLLELFVCDSCCPSKPCHVWRKINGMEPICFKASESGHAEFTSKFSINMWKLKYVRRSGYHECGDGHGGYFGCEAYPYRDGHKDHHVHIHHHHYESSHYDEMMDDEPQRDEPRQDESQDDEMQKDVPASDASTQGPGPSRLQGISVYLTDKNTNVLMPQAPFHRPYFMEPSINRPAWDNSLTLSVCDGPLEILRDQVLRVYHGEDLYDMNTEDNSGELCIDVYAYGDIAG